MRKENNVLFRFDHSYLKTTFFPFPGSADVILSLINQYLSSFEYFFQLNKYTLLSADHLDKTCIYHIT